MKNPMAALFMVFSFQVLGQGGYYNQSAPTSLAPQVFAPFLLSTPYSERDMAISPDGTELYFTIQYTFTRSIIVYTRYENGKWSLIKKAPFSGNQADLEPAFSPDGNQLFFSSNRSVGGSAKDFDIWQVSRTVEGGWSEPELVGGGINTGNDEFYPSLAKNGSLYFTATRSGGKGGEDIWVARWENGQYQTPEVLPEAINSVRGEYNAFVDPDEQYLYFSSDGRTDAIGGGDLYISRKDAAGNWMPAGRLNLNSQALDYCPYVTPDGNYFFFTSEREVESDEIVNPFDITSVLKHVLAPKSGQGNIYWARK